MSDQKKASSAHQRAVRKYDRKNSIGLYLKFNKKTDSDIIAKLASIKNRQGYVKRLIRDDIEKEGK